MDYSNKKTLSNLFISLGGGLHFNNKSEPIKLLPIGCHIGYTIAYLEVLQLILIIELLFFERLNE